MGIYNLAVAVRKDMDDPQKYASSLITELDEYWHTYHFPVEWAWGDRGKKPHYSAFFDTSGQFNPQHLPDVVDSSDGELGTWIDQELWERLCEKFENELPDDWTLIFYRVRW